ncbi:hypothetical protein CONPUDRAFT_80927 [Coniophora puteana RWD-64-598 SS2]|uniref:Zinc-finger domain-containing protein n=1 Tax=Coniophora puteana (strain RWD-64-598) TaxID=741705 RepID=A0A5M3MUK2_CONPW|nr:uncharacterized protein CONPUDRAFT_80927 [Coniophora puteana RWD-64-598 SS2]EIW82677.1 hypothetical protein CONPUDRAFT_80927 [Coniophora puteana RWD-64-598 SS2]
MSALHRRKSTVFVDIPPSPLHKHHRSASINSSFKENAPSMANVTHKKRKSVGDMEALKSVKKFKVDMIEDDKLPNANEEFPRGFFYCHQCNRKRDISYGLRCTYIASKAKRCNTRYCKPCIRNRYGISADGILSAGVPSKSKGHVPDAGYIYKCPRCADECNCVRCRKAKGLQPTGNLTLMAKRAGVASASAMLKDNPKALGPQSGKSVVPKKQAQHRASLPSAFPSTILSSKSIASTIASTTSAPSGPTPVAEQTKPKPAKPRYKPKPYPHWRALHTRLPLASAEDRIHIREFALRFSTTTRDADGNERSVLKIPRATLDELECVAGKRGGTDAGKRGRGDAEDEPDEGALAPWVSEGCVKSLVLAMLSMLYDEAVEDEDEEEAGELDEAIKAIKSSSTTNSLQKIARALSSLDRSFGLPEPHPPPANSARLARSTRSAAAADARGEVEVVCTAQLVPVIAALISAAIPTDGVRAALEGGFEEAREVRERAKALGRAEKERYREEKEQEKASTDGPAPHSRLRGSKNAPKRAHEARLESYDHLSTLACASYEPRIAPLGRDSSGRVYWALTPGPAERESARELLDALHEDIVTVEGAGKTKAKKTKRQQPKKRSPPTENEREGLRRWCWGVVVWGERPPEAERAFRFKVPFSVGSDGEVEDADDSDSEDEDGPAQRWWGFAESQEIERLASYVLVKAGLHLEEGQSSIEKSFAVASAKANVAAQTQVNSKVNGKKEKIKTKGKGKDNNGDGIEQSNEVRVTSAEVRELVQRLDEYASLLRWRLKEPGEDGL